MRGSVLAAVVLVLLGLSRKVALRVDGTGITLGGSPLRYDATTLRVPWSDVDAVVLWKQATHTNGVCTSPGPHRGAAALHAGRRPTRSGWDAG